MRHCYRLKAGKVKAADDSKHLRWIVQNLAKTDRGNACALHALIQGVDRAAVRLQALRLALIVMPTDSSSLWNDQPLLEVSEDAWVGPECRNRCR